MMEGWAQVAGNVGALGFALFVFWMTMQDLKKSIDMLGKKLDKKTAAIWDAVSRHKDDKELHVHRDRIERLEDKLDAKQDKIV